VTGSLGIAHPISKRRRGVWVVHLLTIRRSRSGIGSKFLTPTRSRVACGPTLTMSASPATFFGCARTIGGRACAVESGSKPGQMDSPAHMLDDVKPYVVRVRSF